MEAEGGAVSSLYPDYISTVSLQREVSAESCGGGRWWVVVAAAGRVVVVEDGGGRGWLRRRVVEAEGSAVSSLYPHCILTVSSLYPHCIPPKRGVCGVLRRRKVVGGGGSDGGGWQRGRAAEYDTVSSLYPHCILTVSIQREAEGDGWWRWQWKAEGGGWWRRRVLAAEDGTVSSVYPCKERCLLRQRRSRRGRKNEGEE